MRTQLPTSVAAPESVERAFWPDEPRPGRRRRVRLTALGVVVVLLAAFWLVSGGQSPTTKVRIDGRTVWVDGRRPTVGAALDAGRVRPREGQLFSVVTHHVIDAHATPAQLFVDGAPAERGQRVKAGDSIVAKNGDDATEKVVSRRVQGIGPGLPPIEDRIWISGAGSEEAQVGERSGEIVSRSGTAAPAEPAHAETGMVVALTFDDGPDPRWTPAIMQILKDENIKATFCSIGYLAQRHPELVKAEFDAGHTVCDHSMHHILTLPSRPHPQILDEVLQAADVDRTITGENPLFYRPPGGNLNQDIIDTAHQRGLRVLKWSVDPKDYTKPPAPMILARIEAKVGPGAVILLHDGGGDRSQTVAMLKQLIDDLKHRGFTFYNWQ
ncbi:MAG TPA: polysaccharide deacetylase family protein [Acidimicrobiales bacterium]|nr:polysaccharide deacetylase family protein [Acidimicrobiales bacterium]